MLRCRHCIFAGLAALSVWSLLLAPTMLRNRQRAPPPSAPPPALFAYATFADGDALGEGLHVLVSEDAHHWTPLVEGDPILARPADVGTVFRDPSIVYLDGWFHLAYTTELCVGIPVRSFGCDWHRRDETIPPRLGYARSRDLLSWQDHVAVPVQLQRACNVWAPEWLEPGAADARALGSGLAIVFSATVASPCPPDFGPGAGHSRHRPYAMAAFVAEGAPVRFGAPRLVFDFGESVIDATFFSVPPNGATGDSTLYTVYKSEQNTCRRWRWDAGGELHANRSCTLALRLARAPSLFGPYEPAPLGRTPVWTNSLSRQCVEGPSVLRLEDEWLVFYDAYRTDCPLHVTPTGLEGCAPLPGLEIAHPKPVGAEVVFLLKVKDGTTQEEKQVRTTGTVLKYKDDEDSTGAPKVQLRHAKGTVWVEQSALNQPECTYRNTGGLGALRSANLRDWDDVGASVHLPPRHKHGTVIPLPPEALASTRPLASVLAKRGLLSKTTGKVG